MNRLSNTLIVRIALVVAATVCIWLIATVELGVVAIFLAGFASLVVVGELLERYFSPDAASRATAPVVAAVPATPLVATPVKAPSAPSTSKLGDTDTILSTLDDAVFAYDGLFRVIFANDAAVSLLGIPREELNNFLITPQLSQQDPRYTRLVQIVYPSLAPLAVPHGVTAKGVQIVDLTFENPELHYRVSSVTLPEHRGFLKVVRDRTRQIEIVRSKGEFVTVASHQLRTPLTEISWALETLAGSTTLGPDDKALAAQTLDSVKSLIRTAEDLLGVAKIEQGRFGYAFAPLDIVQLLDEELGKALPIVQSTGLKLFFDRPASPLPMAIADKNKISMVINNLIENAMRYNVANGEITVKAEVVPNEPFVKVSVRDTGIGIAQEDVEKLFTKFFRADNAKKAIAGGTGLGLYIASNIMRAHGGQMGVGSELGRGSTFWFTLATDEKRVPQREVAEDF